LSYDQERRSFRGVEHRFLHEVLRRLWLGYKVQGNGESQRVVPFQQATKGFGVVCAG
jgi:hypothetical protein